MLERLLPAELLQLLVQLRRHVLRALLPLHARHTGRALHALLPLHARHTGRALHALLSLHPLHAGHALPAERLLAGLLPELLLPELLRRRGTRFLLLTLLLCLLLALLGAELLLRSVLLALLLHGTHVRGGAHAGATFPQWLGCFSDARGAPASRVTRVPQPVTTRPTTSSSENQTRTSGCPPAKAACTA
ncbi:hypothetical protein GCM10010277_40360 [Streptomyces longisporoflavus]|nr:hypothetical protein GCM10010277_40360 [Streptomyces longisporoflavus]